MLADRRTGRPGDAESPRTPSTELIRVLLVEDNPAGAELELRELKRAGLRVEHLLVQDEAAFRRALAEFSPQLILSDFSMPQFNGMDALALARELTPDTPFIFVSATIGEEYAIRALKNGATDYVLKGNLLRLPAAFERALEAAREAAARRREQETLRESEERFRGLLESAADGIAVCDRDGRLVTVNPQFATIFGYGAEELLHGSIERLVPPELRERHESHFKGFVVAPSTRRMAGGVPLEGVRKDGTRIQIEVSLSSFPSKGELQMTCIVRDVTEEVQRRERLARLARIRDLIGAVSAATLRLRERQALFEEFCRIGVERGGFRSAHLLELDRASKRLRIAVATDSTSESLRRVIEDYNRDPANATSLVAEALQNNRPAVSNDASADGRLSSGSLLASEGVLSIACLPFATEDEVCGVIVLRAGDRGAFDEEEMRLLEELTGNLSFALDLMEKQKRLDYLAYYDVLTGLPNSALFRDRLEQRVTSARRDRHLFSVVVLDLERFRNMNDTLGREMGDELLRHVAQRLKSAADETNILARVGGDQFAIATRRTRDAGEIVHILDQVMKNAFGLPVELGGSALRLAARAGVAVYPADGADAGTLLRNAEAALRDAKNKGDRYQFYAPQMNAAVAETLLLENRMRGALEQQQFVLHYQPKFNLGDGSLSGLEALIRWNDPESGLVPPMKFIPLLEETGLILDVGGWAIQKGLEDYRRWSRPGLRQPRIAVNVSPVQLRQKNFVGVVRDALEASAPGAHGLDLEITESLIMEDIEGNIAKLRAIRDMGVNIYIDDFGTGYSSLGYLSKLPVTALKIDRSFVDTMMDTPDDMNIVSTIISLAHSLNLRVVAEGVETEEQMKALKLLRCDEGQGYLFSRPVPAGQVEPFFGRPAAV